jgi:uncharacterized membrane protein
MSGISATVGVRKMAMATFMTMITPIISASVPPTCGRLPCTQGMASMNSAAIGVPIMI